MATYRGVDQHVIASSIREVWDFLHTHTTGPALEAHLRQVSAYWPDEIEGAQTNADLADIIRRSNIRSNLTWIKDILFYHSVFDTDNKGANLYHTLQEWGALSRKLQGTQPNTVSHEINKYIELRSASIQKSASTAPAVGK